MNLGDVTPAGLLDLQRRLTLASPAYLVELVQELEAYAAAWCSDRNDLAEARRLARKLDQSLRNIYATPYPAQIKHRKELLMISSLISKGWPPDPPEQTEPVQQDLFKLGEK